MAQSLAKGLRILFLFTRTRDVMTVKDMADGIQAPLPTVYRLVRVLTQHGLLEKTAQPGQYQLGRKLLEFEGCVRHRVNIADVARPVVEKLARVSGETVQLTLRNEDHGVCILVEESHSALRVAPETGRVLPLHAGASVQVLLAYLPEEEQRRMLGLPLHRFTPRTLTDPHRLLRRLRDIRRRGYAVSQGEAYPGAMGIAAPIFGPDGRATASLAVSGPAQRMAVKRAAITEATVLLAREISEVMGGGLTRDPRTTRTKRSHGTGTLSP
jgi:DNA-binding IclR family transcriptional regulator